MTTNGNDQRPKAPMAKMHWAEAIANMHEEDAARFQRHKAMLRASMMKAFVETCRPTDWSPVDDHIQDVLIHWLIGIQARGGSTIKSAGEHGDASIAQAKVVEDQGGEDQGSEEQQQQT